MEYKEALSKEYVHPTTGLLNRYFLLDKGNDFLKKLNTLLVLDVRNLTKYNELFGYEFVDELLRVIAKILKRFFYNKESFPPLALGFLECGRFWILKKVENPTEENLKKLANRLIKILTEKPLCVDENFPILISVNIGIAVYPNHGKNIRELLRKAEFALDISKQQGENTFLIFNEKFAEEIRTSFEIENRIKRLISENRLKEEIYPVFQLRINVQKGEIPSAVEVLMRFGNFSPALFIPIAENAGLIGKMFEALVENTIPFMREALNIAPDLKFSFNVSPIQLKNFDEFLKTWEKLAIFPFKNLELEITESAILEEKEELLRKLNILSLYGIDLLIDDFGKGFSSFDRLRFLDISGVKLDMSITRKILEEEDYYQFLKSIRLLEILIKGLKEVEFKVIAEGIEDIATAELLKFFGVDEIQGFLYSKPVKGKEFLEKLKSYFKNY